MEEFRSGVTSLLVEDLKINESFFHKTSSLFYSVEKMTLESVFGRQMDFPGQATILFPSWMNSSIPKQSIVFIRVNLFRSLFLLFSTDSDLEDNHRKIGERRFSEQKLGDEFFSLSVDCSSRSEWREDLVEDQ